MAVSEPKSGFGIGIGINSTVKDLDVRDIRWYYFMSLIKLSKYKWQMQETKKCSIALETTTTLEMSMFKRPSQKAQARQESLDCSMIARNRDTII